jgi:hypothetical protein
MGRSRHYVAAILLLIAGSTLLLLYATRAAEAPAEPHADPGAQPEPVTPVEATPAPELHEPDLVSPQYLHRFGVTAPADDVLPALDAGLLFGSYADWQVNADPPGSDRVDYWQVIRLQDGAVRTPRAEIAAAIAANPGAVWLIGNEPDVVVQDNTEPQRYAELYHELYNYIKLHDPTARIAIGAVSQPTPLRRAYLDIVLDSYEARYGQRMPVDIWNVHAFILREEYDSWGIGIPPGMSDDLAIQYELEDHLDIDIFRQNLVEFRAWMAERGYGDRPLLVSEYGFLMPHDYGFSPQEVSQFMTATFDFFLSARNDTGYAADDGRLVQWWFWFILSGPANDEYAPTFLYDRHNGHLTDLGQAYADYVRTNHP